MFPFLNDASFAYGAAEMKVVAANHAYLFAVEVGLTVFDDCGKFADTHFCGQNRSVLAFQACLLLNGYVHEPPVVVLSAKKFAFPHLKLQWGLLFVG
jgi:hypothetical protein